MSQSSIDWGVAGRMLEDALAAGALIIAAVMTVLRPFFDTLIHGCLGRNREKLKALINDIYVAEFKQREDAARNAATALEISTAHTDSLRALQTSIERQGEELRDLPQIASTLERSFGVMTETLSEMQREMSKQGRDIGNISGYLQGLAGKPWDGQERRDGFERRG